MNHYQWPACTGVEDCGHVATHVSPDVADEFARERMAEYVNRNGYAVCACHADRAPEYGVQPFLCDQAIHPTP